MPRFAATPPRRRRDAAATPPRRLDSPPRRRRAAAATPRVAAARRYYASSSAIDDAAILENLAPRLQEDVANYLLHDAIKHHPLFRDLPEGTLWKVLAIVRQVSFDPDAVVIASDAPSSTLFILHQGTCACAYNGKSRQGLGEGTSFGELCMLGLSTTSLVTCTCETACVFFFIPRDPGR